jgi:hypothetical protein
MTSFFFICKLKENEVDSILNIRLGLKKLAIKTNNLFIKTADDEEKKIV